MSCLSVLQNINKKPYKKKVCYMWKCPWFKDLFSVAALFENFQNISIKKSLISRTYFRLKKYFEMIFLQNTFLALSVFSPVAYFFSCKIALIHIFYIIHFITFHSLIYFFLFYPLIHFFSFHSVIHFITIFIQLYYSSDHSIHLITFHSLIHFITLFIHKESLRSL